MVLLFRMSRHQVVLINLHRSLHGKSRILCEIMVYTVFSVLVPFTNTLSINEFQVSSKSVSEKAFLDVEHPPFFLQKLFSPHFASTLPPTSCIPLSIGIYPAVEATKKGGSKICFHLLKMP